MAFTIALEKQSPIQKAKPALPYLLLIMILAVLAYGFSLGIKKFIPQESFLSVETMEPASVYLNSKLLGSTPVKRANIPSGPEEVKVQSKTSSSLVYQTSLEVEPRAEVSIVRDLGVSSFFSSGRDLWLQKGGTSITVISRPTDASVFLDGTEMGKTPFSSASITEGEYDLKISTPSFEPQTMRIKVVKGYKLSVSAQLFPIPLPYDAKVFENSGGLWDLTIDDENIASSRDRAKAVVYWMRTRPQAISSGETVKFAYFLDYRGNIYDGDGNLISDSVIGSDGIVGLQKESAGGYLGFDSTKPGLTPEAKKAYETIFAGTPEVVKVLDTGTGWLRVRKSPSLTGAEIDRVKTGDTLTVLERQAEWIKIRLKNGQEGWVSSAFVK